MWFFSHDDGGGRIVPCTGKCGEGWLRWLELGIRAATWRD